MADKDAPEPERAVRDEIGARRPGAQEAPQPPRADGIPLWLVRGIAVATVVTLAAVLGRDLWQRINPPGPNLSSALDQRLVIVAQREVRVRIVVDDAQTIDRVLPNGERLELTACCRMELTVPAVEAVKISYNGESIVPQGRQDEARRLVFVDDVGH